MARYVVDRHVFVKIQSLLLTLYALVFKADDEKYWANLRVLDAKPDVELLAHLGVPPHFRLVHGLTREHSGYSPETSETRVTSRATVPPNAGPTSTSTPSSSNDALLATPETATTATTTTTTSSTFHTPTDLSDAGLNLPRDLARDASVQSEAGSESSSIHTGLFDQADAAQEAAERSARQIGFHRAIATLAQISQLHAPADKMRCVQATFRLCSKAVQAFSMKRERLVYAI